MKIKPKGEKECKLLTFTVPSKRSMATAARAAIATLCKLLLVDDKRNYIFRSPPPFLAFRSLI